LEDDPANMDFASPRDFVASVRSWRQLSGSSPDLEAYADKPVNKTVTVNLVAGAVGPGSSEQPTLQPVRIHGSMIPPARDALTSGGSVYFGGQQGAADQVLFTLIVSADGEHYFAGDCAYYGLTDPLRSSLRGGYDSELNRVVGMTTQADILDLLVPAQRSPSSS
jgi:hypothetical protein